MLYIHQVLRGYSILKSPDLMLKI